MLNSWNVLRILLWDSLEPVATLPRPWSRTMPCTATAWISTRTGRSLWRSWNDHSSLWLLTLWGRDRHGRACSDGAGGQSAEQWRTGPRLLHYRYSSPVDGRRINKGAIYELSEWNSYDSVNNRIIWITAIVGILVLKLSLSFLIQEIRLAKDVESGIYSCNTLLYSYYRLWWASVQNVQNQAGRTICSE